LSGVVTGDTILDASSIGKKGDKHFHFEGIDVPEAVFYCSVEPPNVGSIARLEKALAEICVEDPSFRVRQDAETGQTVVETMGELHAEVLKYRLQNDYKLDVFIGPLQISYREVIDKSAEHTRQVHDSFDDQRNQSCMLTLRVEPSLDPLERFKSVTIALEDDEKDRTVVHGNWLKAINEGCKNALFNGPVLGCSVQGVAVKLLGISTSGGRINPALLSACASEALTGALRKAGAYLIEPVMLIEVDLFDDGRSEGSSAILHELTKRRAIIVCAQEENLKTHTRTITAKLPLAEASGISRAIRASSSGMASFNMQLHEYQRVSPEQQHAIIAQRQHG